MIFHWQSVLLTTYFNISVICYFTTELLECSYVNPILDNNISKYVDYVLLVNDFPISFYVESLDEEWEKDFDIEVTEEELKSELQHQPLDIKEEVTMIYIMKCS